MKQSCYHPLGLSVPMPPRRRYLMPAKWVFSNLKYYLHSHRCPKFRPCFRHFVTLFRHTSEFHHRNSSRPLYDVILFRHLRGHCLLSPYGGAEEDNVVEWSGAIFVMKFWSRDGTTTTDDDNIGRTDVKVEILCRCTLLFDCKFSIFFWVFNTFFYNFLCLQ